jgi:fibronectin type III domain protein
MSQLETSASGNPLRTINASAGSEVYTLPQGFASGRTVTVRREDSGSGGNTVTVTVPTGHSLNGRLNGSRVLTAGTEATFICVNPGQWFAAPEETPGNFTIPALEAVPLTVYGDSYGQGSQGADQASRPFNRISVRHKTQTPTIRAVAGTRMDQIAAAIASSWTANGRGLVGFSDGCINDVLQYGDDVGRFTTREAFRTCLAYLTAWSIATPPSPSLVFGPGWSSAVSSTVGSYVDFAWTAASAHLLIGFVTGSGGTVEVRDTSGALLATVTTGGYKQAFTGCVRLTGDAAQAKTVRATLTSGSATIVGLTVTMPTPPPIAWDKAGRLSSNDTTATRLALYYTECASIVADYPSVIQVDMGAGWDYRTMISEDATHRNDLGSRYATDRVETELVAALASDFRQGLNRLTAAAGAGTYTAPAPSYTAPGATAPAQVTGVSAVAGSLLDVSWAVPGDGGSTLTGFTVRYRVTGQSTWTTYAGTISPTTTLVSLPDVTPTTGYDVQVAAINALGTGAFSATATGTSAVQIVTHSADTFTRADGVIGSTETGSFAWTVTGGTATVAGNMAALAATAGSSGMTVLVDDSQVNGSISVTLASVGNSGCVARATGSVGYVLWRNSTTGYTLSKRTGAAAYTQLGATSGITPAIGDVLTLVVNGSTISARINGVTRITATDSTYATGSVGMWTQSTTTANLDNFIHTSSTAA